MIRNLRCRVDGEHCLIRDKVGRAVAADDHAVPGAVHGARRTEDHEVRGLHAKIEPCVGQVGPVGPVEVLPLVCEVGSLSQGGEAGGHELADRRIGRLLRYESLNRDIKLHRLRDGFRQTGALNLYSVTVVVVCTWHCRQRKHIRGGAGVNTGVSDGAEAAASVNKPLICEASALCGHGECSVGILAYGRSHRLCKYLGCGVDRKECGSGGVRRCTCSGYNHPEHVSAHGAVRAVDLEIHRGDTEVGGRLSEVVPVGASVNAALPPVGCTCGDTCINDKVGNGVLADDHVIRMVNYLRQLINRQEGRQRGHTGAAAAVHDSPVGTVVVCSGCRSNNI